MLFCKSKSRLRLLKIQSVVRYLLVCNASIFVNSASETYKLNPGAVEAVIELQDELIIGYERGLITKWSQKLNKSVKYLVENQQLEYLSMKSPTEIVSAHNDGSYIVWDLEKDKKQSKIVYGPYPCKKISKIVMIDDLTIFSGGLPRADCGDHFSVSVLTPKKHIVFDFTSRIIDFEVIDGGDAVVVLAEEELIAIDLKDEDWAVFQNPYLNSIHPSAVTCFHHCQISEDLDFSGGEDGVKYSKNVRV